MQETAKYSQSEVALIAEESLIADAKNNPALFSGLYDKYYEPIFRFVYQRLDDKDFAFDTTQQVFLKALNNIAKYEFRGFPFSSWLYRIASNELTNVFRANKAIRTVNIESVFISDIIEEIQETKIDKYHDKIVKIIGEELNDEELQLIEMRFFEKRSFKEIAEIINITENNAKVKTYRILDKLKKVLNDK